MVFLLKLIGAAILVGIVCIGLFAYDLFWNGGALFYRFAGRDALVEACTPPLRENLIGKGFTPVDLAFGPTPALSTVSGPFGQTKSLADAFTFSDGHEGLRVDGRVLCRLSGRSVEVEVEVDSLPRRVT